MNDKLLIESIESDLTLNIFENSLELDPMELFPESVNFTDEILTEAATATKGNIFTKIGNILKRCWKWICKQATAIINGIKRFFGKGDHPKQSMDQIAARVLGISILTTAAVGGAAAAVVANQQKVGPLSDPIMNNIASDVMKGDYQSAQSHRLRLEYDDGETIKFHVLANTLYSMFSPEGPVHKERFTEGLAITFHILKRPDALDPLIQILQGIKDTHNFNGDIGAVKNHVLKILKATLKPGTYVTTLEDWVTFNNKASKFSTLLAETWDNANFTITQNGEGLSDEWINVFNKFALIGIGVQGGLNIISDHMRQSYILDVAFHDRVTTVDKLDEFVYACIQCDIPGKYIIQNVKLVTDISLNSKRDNPKEKNVEMGKMSGHGRYPLFPQDQSKCIKIGYNLYGIRSNLIERNIWDDVSKWPEIANELCAIREGSKNNTVLVMDRAVPKEIPAGEAAAAGNKINGLLQKHNVPYRIVDINYKGFGEVNGKRVCLDYGQLRRLPGSGRSEPVLTTI